MFEQPQDSFSQILNLISSEPFTANANAQTILDNSKFLIEQACVTNLENSLKESILDVSTNTRNYVFDYGVIELRELLLEKDKTITKVTLIPASEAFIKSNEPLHVPKVELLVDLVNNIAVELTVKQPLKVIPHILAAAEHIRIFPKNRYRSILFIPESPDPYKVSSLTINSELGAASAMIFQKWQEADKTYTCFVGDYRLPYGSTSIHDKAEDVILKITSILPKHQSTLHYSEPNDLIPFRSIYRGEYTDVDCSFQTTRKNLTIPLSGEDIQALLKYMTIATTNQISPFYIDFSVATDVVIKTSTMNNLPGPFFVEVSIPDNHLLAKLVIGDDLRIIQAVLEPKNEQ